MNDRCRRVAGPLLAVCFGAIPASAGPSSSVSVAANDAIQFETPFLEGAVVAPNGSVARSAYVEEITRWNVGGTADPSFPSSKPGFHPAVRVLVNATTRSGSASPKRSRKPASRRPRAAGVDGVLAQIRNHGYWPFRLCYEDGLHEHAALRGESRIRFALDSRGRIGRARLIATDFAPRDAALCLVQAVKHLRFEAPPPRRVELELSIKLSPGDVPLAPASSVAPSSNAKFDATAVLAAASARRAEFERCYTEGLTRTPGLWGRAELHLDIDANGRATSVEERGSRFPDTSVRECVSKVLERVPFEAAGTAFRVVVPIRFGQPPAPATPPAPADGAPPAPPAHDESVVGIPPAPPAGGSTQ